MPTIRDQVINIKTALRSYRMAAGPGGDSTGGETIAALGALTVANTEMLLQVGYELDRLMAEVAVVTVPTATPAPAPEPIESEPAQTEEATEGQSV
jgi:hypothetical protein